MIIIQTISTNAQNIFRFDDVTTWGGTMFNNAIETAARTHKARHGNEPQQMQIDLISMARDEQARTQQSLQPILDKFSERT